ISSTTRRSSESGWRRCPSPSPSSKARYRSDPDVVRGRERRRCFWVAFAAAQDTCAAGAHRSRPFAPLRCAHGLVRNRSAVMIWENIFFGVIAAAMAISALGVVTTKNVVHAALFLVVVLAGGAAQFLLLGQEFVAWVQVLVYIGAVIVLFLFGIMLTRAPMNPEESLDNDLRWPGAAAALFLAGILGTLLVH